MCIYIYTSTLILPGKQNNDKQPLWVLGRCDDFKGTAPFFFVTNANIRADGHQSSDQPGMFWRLIPWYPVKHVSNQKLLGALLGMTIRLRNETMYIYIYTYVCIIDFGRTLGSIPSFCKGIFPLPPMLAAPLLSVFYTPFSGTSKTSRSRCLLLGVEAVDFQVPSQHQDPDLTSPPVGPHDLGFHPMPWRSSQENEATQYPNDILLAGNHHHKNEKKKTTKTQKQQQQTWPNRTFSQLNPNSIQFWI